MYMQPLLHPRGIQTASQSLSRHKTHAKGGQIKRLLHRPETA